MMFFFLKEPPSADVISFKRMSKLSVELTWFLYFFTGKDSAMYLFSHRTVDCEMSVESKYRKI